MVAEFNQRAYELFGRPLVRMFANEYGARLAREFHPMRFQRWACSDLNPFLWWLEPAAAMVKEQRQALASDHPARKMESALSEVVSASFDCGRALRDALAEATFFEIYGNLFATYLEDGHAADAAPRSIDPRELPFVKQALAAVDQGGYAEALARVAFLMAHRDEPLPLSRLHLAQEMIDDYRALLPDLTPDEARRIGGEQEIIARYARDQAIATLPKLLARRGDRERLLDLLDRVLADKRVQRIEPSPDQLAALARIRSVLGAAEELPAASRRRRPAAAMKGR